MAVEYLIVNKGIPSNSSLYDSSCDGLWLLRKDIYTTSKFSSSYPALYNKASIHTYLNSTFLALFDANTAAQIKTVKIPYAYDMTSVGGTVKSGADGLSTQIFLLGGYEVNYTTSNSGNALPEDGATLDYFSGCSVDDTKLAAYYNDTLTSWWLRSTLCNGSSVDLVYLVYGYTTALARYQSCSGSHGVRPALILNSDALFDSDNILIT